MPQTKAALYGGMIKGKHVMSRIPCDNEICHKPFRYLVTPDDSQDGIKSCTNHLAWAIRKATNNGESSASVSEAKEPERG